MEQKASSLKGEVISHVVRELGLQQNADILPSKISDVIQPVIEVTKKYVDICYYRNSTGAFYTTSATKDTYLTGAIISGCQIAGGGTANNQIYFTPEGLGSSGYVTQTLDATGGGTVANSLAMPFSVPIKLARNTAVGFTLGTPVGSGSVFLYEVTAQ